MRSGIEWDEWYHELCTVVAKKSQCHSRKIGAILVKDKAVVSQGYNDLREELFLVMKDGILIVQCKMLLVFLRV